MRGFRFPLEPLRKLRRFEEEAAQRALADALRAVEAQRGRIRALEAEREEMITAAQAESRLEPAERQRAIAYLHALRQNLLEAGKALASLEGEAQARRAALAEAAKARKVLDRLRERRLEEFKADWRAKEYSRVDEAVLRRFRFLPVLALCLAAPPPAGALDISVTDFRQDFSGSPGDTVRIDPGFGDSLLIAIRTYELRRALTRTLNDGQGRNGASAASPVPAAAGDGRFQVAYVAWPAAHTRQDGSVSPPPADIVSRAVRVGEETVTVDPARVLTAAENHPDTSNPRRFYSGLNIRPPPSYLNYFASDSQYLAYWGTLSIRGSVRRTTDLIAAGGGLPETWGRYVPPAAPVVCEAFGKIGAGLRPGSGGRQAVLAYETTVAANNYGAQVRFENSGTGTSQAASFTRTQLPEDFAVSVDSTGNALVLWRQNSDLYLAGYDASGSEIRAPTLVQAAIQFRIGTTEHYYRPYGAAPLYNGRFILAYVGAVGRVVYRLVNLPYAGAPFSMGVEALVSAAGQAAAFPSVCSENGRIAFTWFQAAGAENHRVLASLWRLQGAQPDPASRLDLDAAGDSVGFGETGAGWHPWHHFKTPACALDMTGNLVTAYDDGFSAKVAVVKNAALRHDSALFISAARRIRNGALAFAGDSAEFRSLALTGDTAGITVSLATAADSAFTSGATPFQVFAAPFRTAHPYFKYRVALRNADTSRLTTPRVRALDFSLNLKPRRVRVDSIRIGSGSWQAYDSTAAYALSRRRDSLHLVLTGFDLDDEASLEFEALSGGNSLLRRACTEKRSPGFIRCGLSLPSFDGGTSVALALTARDAAGWTSSPRALILGLANNAPAESLQVLRHRGQDAGGVFRPHLGPVDTLPMPGGQNAWLHRGDTALVRVRAQDANDASLSFRWFRNGTQLGQQSAASGAWISIPVPLLSPQGRPDTLRVDVADPDTAVSRIFYLRANRLPRLEGLQLAGYQGKDSVWIRRVLDSIADFALDSGLVIPLGQPALLRALASDSDQVNGDAVTLSFTVLTAPGGCARGNASCYVPALSRTADTLLHAFSVPQDFLRLRAADTSGAFVQRLVRLEFPFLDTSAVPANRVALQTLGGALDFVLGAAPSETTVTYRLLSQGTLPLRIDSARTRKNSRRWVDARLSWTDTAGSARQARLDPRTDRNPLPAGGAWLAPGRSLDISIRIFSDSLRGDSTVADTLDIATNDLSTPWLRLPLILRFRDLPVLRFFSGAAGVPPPALLPTRSNLRFAFSETVRFPDDGSGLRIYSYRDSLRSPQNFPDLPGRFATRLRPQTLAKRGGDTLGWADTVLFTPAYSGPALHSGLRPPDGAFMHRDILRVRLSNTIVDRDGNALDLRGDRVRRSPGSLDTLITLRVDTASLRVLRTESGTGSWNPDSSLRVRFNAPLRRRDSSSSLGVDLRIGTNGSNPSVRVISSLLGDLSLGLQSLSLAGGDSTLVIRTRRRAAARDTVTVWLAASLADTAGNTLDGNGDGYPGYVYGGSDTADAFTFAVGALDQGFYTYPNPFRFGDPRHREKGAVTFKNLNSLRGYRAGQDVDLRVYTQQGDLVFSSRKGRRPSDPDAVALDWNLRNDAGSTVATGVYVFTLHQGQDLLLKKGKVAVAR